MKQYCLSDDYYLDLKNKQTFLKKVVIDPTLICDNSHEVLTIEDTKKKVCNCLKRKNGLNALCAHTFHPEGTDHPSYNYQFDAHKMLTSISGILSTSFIGEHLENRLKYLLSLIQIVDDVIAVQARPAEVSSRKGVKTCIEKEHFFGDNNHHEQWFITYRDSDPKSLEFILAQRSLKNWIYAEMKAIHQAFTFEIENIVNEIDRLRKEQ